MKKIISMLLAGCVLLGALAGCAAKPQKVDQVLRERSVAMGQKLSQLVKDPEYRKAFGNWQTEKFDEIAAGEYQQPRAVFGVEFDVEAMRALLEQEEILLLTPEALELYSKRMVVSTPQQINAAAGVETLSATSIMSVESCFVQKGLTKPLLTIALYDGEWAVAAGYRPGEDGAVNVIAMFLYGPALKEVQTVEQMQEWFSTQSMLQGVVRQMG